MLTCSFQNHLPGTTETTAKESVGITRAVKNRAAEQRKSWAEGSQVLS